MIPGSLSPDLTVFFENKFVPLSDARVGILTHALHYGTGVFEGVRGYWDLLSRELYLFRPLEHYDRWRRNCAMLHIHLPYSPMDLCEITAELVRRNGFEENVYVRPLAYKSAQRIGVSWNDESAFFIAALPYGDYLKSAEGIHAGVVSWRRIEDNAIPCRGKISGAYVNSALAGDEARRNGFDEGIFLTESGHVAEGATCNIFIVRSGKLITPPPSDNILEGVTRNTIIELGHDELHLNVIERSIDRSELYIADEVFFTGTAVEIAPITKVDHRQVGLGEVGPVTTKLRTLFFEAAHGHIPEYRKWLVPAYQPVHAEVDLC